MTLDQQFDQNEADIRSILSERRELTRDDLRFAVRLLDAERTRVNAVAALHTQVVAVASANIDDPEVEFDVWVCGHCWNLMRLSSGDAATGPVAAQVLWPCPTTRAMRTNGP